MLLMMLRQKTLVNQVFASLITLVFAFQTGCTTFNKTNQSSSLNPEISRASKVAVITTLQDPIVDFEGFARGKGSAAALGFGNTFGACAHRLAQAGSGCGADPLCGAFVILWLGVCGVAATAGGVAGAVAVEGSDTIKAQEHVLLGALDNSIIQESLRHQTEAVLLSRDKDLVASLSGNIRTAATEVDYSQLIASGVDQVLEVKLTHIGTTGMGNQVNPPLLLHMHTSARVIRLSDSSPISSSNFVYQGDRLTLAEWSANDGQPLLAALQSGYKALADQIYDQFFLLFPFPDRQPQISGLLNVTFGLAPIYPATRGQLTGTPVLGDYLEWITIDQLQPTLSWQAFPRASDSALVPELANRARDVRYDLIIAEEHNMTPAEVVYHRQGLTGNSHKLAISLSPGKRYFWTVRARFTLDDRQRVTEWGSTRRHAEGAFTAPNQNSYRFKTRK